LIWPLGPFQMKSPARTWKPWYCIAALLVMNIGSNVAPPEFAAILFLLIWFAAGWYFWDLGGQLSERLPAGSKVNYRRFKVGVVYILVVPVIFAWFPQDEFLLNNYTPSEYGWRWAMIPVQLAFGYFAFYNLYFLSKAVLDMRNKQGRQEHLVQYLLLFWFFPIGIFFLQPRIDSVLGGPLR